MTVRRAQTSNTLLGTLTSDADLTIAIQIAAVLFVSVLTAMAAQVSVPLPFTPVPLTLTPMVVLIGGAALGPRLGMASQVLYLLAGIVGLPVFAASPTLPPGPLRLLGPTGGYLMSYPFAAFVTGWLAERGFDRRYLTSVLAMTAGLALIFAFGVSWLAWLARPLPTGLSAALTTGLYPFLPMDLVKISLAAAILPTAWSWLGRSD
jgi:biotin transport system substrate-specific component